MSYTDLTLQQLLDDISARTSAPGGGVVAATTLAFAASLARMAATFTATDPDGAVVDEGAAAVRDRLDALRRRATELADADPVAYAAVLGAADEAARRHALQGATDVPLEVVEVAREVAGLATPLATGGRPALRGDAQVAVVLAAGAARAAAQLVRANVHAGGLDTAPIDRVERWVAEADHLAGGVVSP